ncbi:MAG: TonB-dependent receptor [Cryomorphaceae bacterium]|nr:TonB-dependent receptor [Cryomorphaceae bacterium]
MRKTTNIAGNFRLRIPFSSFIFLGVFMLILGDVVQAQRLDSLRQVEVIGTREETDLQNVPRQVIIIDREMIEESASQSLTEILEYAVGVDVRQRGPMDAQTDVSMRGGTFDQTLILIDGIRYNDPQTGHHQMNLPISHHQIERIEILPGGVSSVLGAGAMTGAINIVTKKESGIHGSGETYFGQNNMFGGRFWQQWGAKNYGLALNAQYMQHDGYMENTDFRNTSVNLTGYHKGKKHLLQGMVGMVQRDFGAQNFYTFAFPTQFEAIRGYSAQFTFKYYPDNSTKIRIQGYARQHYDRFELYREGPDYYQYRNGLFIRDKDTVPNWYMDHNYHRSRTAGLEINAVRELTKNHSFSAGIDYRYEGIHSSLLGEFMDEPIPVPGHPRGTYHRFANRHNLALYSEYRGTIQRFTFRAGALGNLNSDFGFHFMPGAALSFKLHSDHLLFTGVNRSFRLPTYTDLYYNIGGAQGSEELLPEESDQVELGYRGGIGSNRFSAVSFYRRGFNLIDWVRFPGESTVMATNINQFDIYGLELSFDKQLSKFPELKRLHLSYSYQESPHENFPFVSVYALDFLRHKLNAGIMGKLGKVLIYNARLTYQDRRGDFTNADGLQQAYPDVWLASLRLTARFSAFDVYTEGSNLFNQNPIYDRGGIVLPGLWIRGGVSVKW